LGGGGWGILKEMFTRCEIMRRGGALLKKGHLYKSLYISMGMGIIGATEYA